MDYRPLTTASAPTRRLSDADRDAAVEDLTTHVASGRLSIPEFDGRAERIYAAVTRADLDSVFQDLPSDTVVEKTIAAPTKAPNREVLAWAGVGILVLTIWLITSIASGGALYFWPIWVIGPWGAMLALHRVTGMPMACSGPRFQ